MIYRIEVSPVEGASDARGESLRRQVLALGIDGVTSIVVSDLYFVQGELDELVVRHLAEQLLCDPLVEIVSWRELRKRRSIKSRQNSGQPGDRIVEVAARPGVTDSVAESLLAAARMLGASGVSAAATGRRYLIRGEVGDDDVKAIAEGLLANLVVHSYAVDTDVTPPFVPTAPPNDEVETVPVFGLKERGLIQLSERRRLALDLEEMRRIQEYYRSTGREPTDIELEMLAQTWSEHCVHKTFRAEILYEERSSDGLLMDGSPRRIDSLLATYIRDATERAAKPWVRSAFVDNAGIIAFDDRFDLAFKVETHNHPSALEPFGGANTGVGGVVRDVIGVGARPIANTDILCFGPAGTSFAELPSGVLHPRRIAAGVIAGIEDYGNKMGIPTVNGAIWYNSGYTANPLVFCGCLGILPAGAPHSSMQPGDRVVVLGGRTGRDGLRGATFSSMAMDHRTGAVAGSAVQIGHPIQEKQVLECVLAARDEGLYSAITDCGAGGLSSAVGEMAAESGADIHLERVPLKYAGLRPWEIWLSEAQERMVLAVPAKHWDRLRYLCAGLDVEATDLGCFTGDRILTLRYCGRVVGQLDVDFLHGGIPRKELRAVWSAPSPEAPQTPRSASVAADLLALLSMPEIRSKEDVVRRFDHEVQGGTRVRPLVGIADAGPGDATVIVPLDAVLADISARPALECASQLTRAIAVACGINPSYGALDPYSMGWAAVDEAMRNCVAVGADPDRIALLDNFCWGDPNNPERLGELVRCAAGCHDAAVTFAAPFVSGKDSLNNEYTGKDGRRHAIPGTLLISALGIVPDSRRAVTMDLKAVGDHIYVLGNTSGEMGGSAYLRYYGVAGACPPRPESEALSLYRALHRAICLGLVRACHDCSEGGLAVAAAEMCLAGRLGMELELGKVPGAETFAGDLEGAFCESLARFVVSVRPDDTPAFEECMRGQPCARAGSVRDDSQFRLIGRRDTPLVEVEVGALELAWRGTNASEV